MTENARSSTDVDLADVAGATVTEHQDYDDSPQGVTYLEAILEGADPDEGFYE